MNPVTTLNMSKLPRAVKSAIKRQLREAGSEDAPKTMAEIVREFQRINNEDLERAMKALSAPRRTTLERL